MINHVRTLFLNRLSSGRPQLGEFGEEFISPDFLPVVYPRVVSGICTTLLGTDGDPLFQNFRLAQAMSILHGNEHTAEYTSSFDSRITYSPFDSGMLAYPYGNSSVKLNSTGMDVDIFGTAEANTSVGRSTFLWDIRTELGEYVTITSAWSGSERVVPIALTGGVSAPIGLDNGINFRVHVPTGSFTPGAKWQIASMVKPADGAPGLLALYISTGAGSSVVFSGAPESLYNLWMRGTSSVDKLAGLWGAAAFQMDKEFKNAK